MSNKSTATPENALSQAEIDEYLNRRIMARMATQRADGYPHLTPIWFVWEDGKFFHTLGADRVHLTNLARDPRMSLVIDEDYRLETASRRAPARSPCAATRSSRRIRT